MRALTAPLNILLRAEGEGANGPVPALSPDRESSRLRCRTAFTHAGNQQRSATVAMKRLLIAVPLAQEKTGNCRARSGAMQRQARPRRLTDRGHHFFPGRPVE